MDELAHGTWLGANSECAAGSATFGKLKMRSERPKWGALPTGSSQPTSAIRTKAVIPKTAIWRAIYEQLDRVRQEKIVSWWANIHRDGHVRLPVASRFGASSLAAKPSPLTAGVEFCATGHTQGQDCPPRRWRRLRRCRRCHPRRREHLSARPGEAAASHPPPAAGDRPEGWRRRRRIRGLS